MILMIIVTNIIADWCVINLSMRLFSLCFVLECLVSARNTEIRSLQARRVKRTAWVSDARFGCRTITPGTVTPGQLPPGQ